jgi:hypothetical protein
MQKIILATILLLAVTANMNAQQMSKVHRNDFFNDTVKSKEKEIALITNVIHWNSYPLYWYIEKDLYTPEFYEVEFSKKGEKYKSLYSKSGIFIQTKYTIKESEYPEEVANSFKLCDYKNWTVIGDKQRIEKKANKMNIYVLTVENGKKTRILYFNEKGELIQ